MALRRHRGTASRRPAHHLLTDGCEDGGPWTPTCRRSSSSRTTPTSPTSSTSTSARPAIRVTVVSDGERALQQIRARQPRLVVLDVGLPGDKDGIAVCRELRRSSNVPVLMLTARDAELDRVLGFEVGADDYVTKPFSPRELVARVKAILRRAAPGGGSAAGRDQRVLLGGEVELDLVRHEVRRRGAVVGLAGTRVRPPRLPRRAPRPGPEPPAAARRRVGRGLGGRRADRRRPCPPAAQEARQGPGPHHRVGPRLPAGLMRRPARRRA